MEMNFNNFTVSQLFTITEVKINVLPSVSISSKNVPSRHGTIFQGAQIGERTITVSITLKHDYEHQFDIEGVPRSSMFQNYVRSIVYYLQTDEPKKLLFSDEPDRYYWAICTGIEIDRMLKLGQGNITFTCNDPYMYATKENVFSQDVDTKKWLVDNYGTVESHPKVKVEFFGDATYLGVVTPESVVQIGHIAKENQTNTTKKYSDHLKTMDNWYVGSQATMSRDCEFDPAITCTCTGEVMKPALVQYDESTKPQSPYGFKGTQMITNLPSEMHSKYFKARLQFDFFSSSESVRDPSQCGAIQVHLLDINNNQIACMGLNDHDTVVELTNMYMKLGYEDVAKYEPTLPTPTTKRYTKAFDNEDQLPSDATLVDSFTRNKGYSTIKLNDNYVEVYNSYKAGKKIVKIYRNELGKELRLKEENGNWFCVYLNSACTSTGWIYHTHATNMGEASDTVYIYTRKIYPDKNIGSMTDIWGYFMVSRLPHSNGKGDIWQLELYRINTNSGKATCIFSKKLTDSTGTKYTSAGKLAKVAVSFLSRQTNKPISKMSFNYLDVETVNAYSEEVEPHIIASTGDIIEIDYSIPSVELNGESILHEVDIGSRFAPLQPFMKTEIDIVSDAALAGEVYLTDKFL